MPVMLGQNVLLTGFKSVKEHCINTTTIITTSTTNTSVAENNNYVTSSLNNDLHCTHYFHQYHLILFHQCYNSERLRNGVMRLRPEGMS